MDYPLHKRLTFWERCRAFASFLGFQTVFLLLSSLVNGLLIFAVELSFAYLLQAFLIRIGKIPFQSVSLPQSLVNTRVSVAMGLMCLAGLAKGGLIWAQTYILGASFEGFKLRHRILLFRWGLHGKSASSSQLNNIFNEQLTSASLAVQAFHAATLQATASLLFVITLMKMSPGMTLPAVILLALLLMPARLIIKKVRRLGKELAQEWELTNVRLQQSIRNLLLIQIYGTQFMEEEKAKGGLNKYFAHVRSVHWYNGVNAGLQQVIGVGAICIMTLPIAFNTHWLAPGLRLTYFYIFFRFISSFSQLSNQVSTIASHWQNFRGLARWWRRAVLEIPNQPATDDTSKSVQMACNDQPFGWEVEAVSFSYPESERKIFDSFSLSVPPGKMTAIVGSSGVGKSTLLGILLGTLSPSQGEVRISGRGELKPLKECRKPILQSIGYVGPDSFMVEGSIEENLRYGLNRAVTENEFWQALDQAQCGFVKELPGQLNYRLSEQGQGLSAGQKQRLSLARALLRNPSALILDEATSNLDIETEKRLIDTFQKLRGKVTIVAVTHRHSLLEVADKSITLSAQ